MGPEESRGLSSDSVSSTDESRKSVSSFNLFQAIIFTFEVERVDLYVPSVFLQFTVLCAADESINNSSDLFVVVVVSLH